MNLGQCGMYYTVYVSIYGTSTSWEYYGKYSYTVYEDIFQDNLWLRPMAHHNKVVLF